MARWRVEVAPGPVKRRIDPLLKFKADQRRALRARDEYDRVREEFQRELEARPKAL